MVYDVTVALRWDKLYGVNSRHGKEYSAALYIIQPNRPIGTVHLRQCTVHHSFFSSSTKSTSSLICTFIPLFQLVTAHPSPVDRLSLPEYLCQAMELDRDAMRACEERAICLCLVGVVRRSGQRTDRRQVCTVHHYFKGRSDSLAVR